MYYFFTKRIFLLLLVSTSCFSLLAQQRTVTGVVLSQDTREAIQGVTVSIKGSTRTTTTNAKGEFTIPVSGDESVLKFSSVGFGYQEMTVGSRATLSVSLLKDVKQLEEFVAVGYTTQKRESLTGAVATVNAKDFEDLPVTNLGAALQGRIAGVAVSGGTSRPGDNATITIRNPITLAKDGPQGTNPLYVIDDVIRTIDDFNFLDPSEVESISVLKDAAAAIYGARSNQGVIIVRTKRGKVGKTQLNFNTSSAINNATQLPSMMNGYQLATYLNSALVERYKYGTTPQGYLTDFAYYTPDELEYFKNHNYNWLNNAWKASHYNRYAVNVSGGSDKATFFAGADYLTQDGNLPNITSNKWTFRANADVKLATGLRAGLSVSGDLVKKDMYLLKQGGENAENDMKGLLYTPGYTPPYINGLPVKLSTNSNQNTIDAFHFFEVQRLNNYNRSNTNILNIQANLDYAIPFVKGLTAKVQYAKTINNTFPKQFGTRYKLYSFNMKGAHNHIYGDSVLSSTPVTNGNRVYFSPAISEQYQFDAYLNYNRKFGRHEISALAVVEQSEYKFDNVQAIKNDPTEGAPDDARFAFGDATSSDVYETESESGQLAYIGRVNYNFSGKYLAEFAFRYDGSTNFPAKDRFGFFPSLSLGWVVSEENFFKNVSFINFLKLRLSAGHLGGDNTKAYAYLQRYTPDATKGPVFGGNNPRVVGTRNEALPNPNIRWDSDDKYNAGLDMRFLGSRLSLGFDGYYDHRYDILTGLTSSVPLTVGSTIGSENYSTINGYGYELSLGWKDDAGKNFSYYANAYLSWNDAKSVKVDVSKGIIGTYEDPTGRTTDLGVKGLHYTGMFRSQAEVDAFLAKNPSYTIYGQVPRPGMLYYQDIRGPKDAVTNKYAAADGKIDDNDLDFIRSRASNHYGMGLSLGAAYKGVRLDVVMSGSFGGYSSVEGAARKLGTLTSSRPAFWTDSWTAENPNAAFPNPYYTSTYDLTSDFWLRSAASFRVRSAQLSYGLSPRLMNKIGFGGLKVYVNATNPLNFYNPYNYKDNAAGSFDSYPVLRTIALGLNASL